jgi:ornithine cyclodeaminase/alanine dehydrogenase-like protein (mu-crystallin family)
MPGSPGYFAAKTNANFPGNPKQGLPTIQGAILLFDAGNGRLLAITDSAEVTALRTAATTAVAAKYLAKRSATTLTLVGCGAQAHAQLQAVAAIRSLRCVYVSDIDAERAARFAEDAARRLHIEVAPASDLEAAVAASEICITCTPSHRYIIDSAWVKPGSFLAGIGADSEHKQEIDPALFRSARVVVDSLSQCAAIGDLHHALEAGVISRGEVHAELGEVIAGQKAARQSETETILFDSTGVALTDVAVAARVYELALERRRGTFVSLTA